MTLDEVNKAIDENEKMSYNVAILETHLEREWERLIIYRAKLETEEEKNANNEQNS